MKTIRVQTGTPYEVLVGSGILSTLGRAVKRLPGKRYAKAAVITDDKVQALYGNTVCASLAAAGLEVVSFDFPNGEASKNISTVQDILGFLSDNYLTRSDVVIALGGGVTGDMAGFAASIYLRGVDYIQVPTTLLAAIDSSVGGKTAVNLPQGKNLVGTFWQPQLVLCDIHTLDTLDDDIFADGLAEAVKHGCIWDAELFRLMETRDIRHNLAEIIARSVEIKSYVVGQDEREHGLRQILNFGHTLAHGIEKMSHFEISHGKAVSMGICLITGACVANGLMPAEDAKRIKVVLERCDLPTRCPYPLDKLCKECLGDKKRSGDTINLIVLERIGKAAVHPVKIDELLPFIKRK